jgi:hypothetical protein
MKRDAMEFSLELILDEQGWKHVLSQIDEVLWKTVNAVVHLSQYEINYHHFLLTSHIINSPEFIQMQQGGDFFEVS